MPTTPRPLVALVTPALADANNGNWQTASRWARLLRPYAEVEILPHWPGGSPARPEAHTRPPAPPHTPPHTRPHDALLALHAGRSAASIQAWHAQRGRRGLAVVLTGTDLYRDLPGDDPQARATVLASLEAAARIVVLQDQAPHDLPPALRAKAQVIFQSTATRRPLLNKSSRHLRAVMVGHLRSEKDPLTLMKAARLLKPQDGILIDHIGGPLDAALAEAARETARLAPHYRWLGALPHEAARRRIQRAHVLIHSSRLEGGAHVIMEAVCSGTPVLASRMAGNVGMLGAEYGAYFEVGDAAALAAHLKRLRQHPADLRALQAQCDHRAKRFAPEEEARCLRSLVGQLLAPDPLA